MTDWSDFFTSAPIPFSSNADIVVAISEKLFIKFSYFKTIYSAIRVKSANEVESLISDTVFSDCYSNEIGGVVFYELNKGSSIFHRICAYNCCSTYGRSFGYIDCRIVNFCNFSSFLFCPSQTHNHIEFGSITLLYGNQIVNNINASHNYGSKEGCIIFAYQTSQSFISYVLCIDSHCIGERILYVGGNVLVFTSTVIRCSSKENLVHFYSPGEIVGCNIIDCEADFAIGCANGVSKAVEVFINNNLPVNQTSIIMVRPLHQTIIHQHLVLQTYECHKGALFPQSTRAKSGHRAVLLVSLILK